MNTSPNKLIVIGAFFSIYIIWGSTYLANAYGVERVPPFFWAGMRFVLASALIFLIMKILRIPFHVEKEEIKNSAIAGILFLTFGNGLMCWALQYIDSGFMSLLVSGQPLILLLMIWVLDGKRPQWMSIIGTLLGLVGMYLLIDQSELINTRNEFIGLGICLICLLAWGYASLFVARVPIPKNHFLNAGIQMFVGGILLMVVSLIFETGQLAIAQDLSLFYILCLLYLVVFGSIIAFTSFNFLLQHISPEKVATSTYINPIVALILGWYFRDELITNRSILATAILFTGVYFINSDRYKSKAKDAKP